MNKHEQVQSKTVLEYMVMINEQSYSGIGRQLQITPQQFSDWIKNAGRFHKNGCRRSPIILVWMELYS